MLQLPNTPLQLVLEKFEYLPIKCKVAMASQNLLRYREELANRLKAGMHSLKTKAVPSNPQTANFHKLSPFHLPLFHFLMIFVHG